MNLKTRLEKRDELPTMYPVKTSDFALPVKKKEWRVGKTSSPGHTTSGRVLLNVAEGFSCALKNEGSGNIQLGMSKAAKD